jgi:archaellum component FlaC
MDSDDPLDQIKHQSLIIQEQKSEIQTYKNEIKMLKEKIHKLTDSLNSIQQNNFHSDEIDNPFEIV